MQVMHLVTLFYRAIHHKRVILEPRCKANILLELDSQMELEINVVDAFTDVAFKGNSAAVIITKDWLSDELMQSIAIENNLSETAYVKK
jgi:hypothetical protein